MLNSTTSSSRPAPTPNRPSPKLGVLHGAGYVGGELVRLLTAHPAVVLHVVTSRTYAGHPVHDAHPSLRGEIEHTFVAMEEVSLESLDALVVAAEHGHSMQVIPTLIEDGFDGPIVDLSADFRFRDASVYPNWFDLEHPAPRLLQKAAYGLPELREGTADASLVANPGCYATGIALALAPLAQQDVPFGAHVTALTGASGSGAIPSNATHFPTRDGNVKPYKVGGHQHEPEITQAIGAHVDLRFVPASGPWSRGIWGTAHVEWPHDLAPANVTKWFEAAYAEAPFVRLTPGALPALQPTLGTPFCDLGWTVQPNLVVVGFALDNLLKGAASQAVQNLNLALDLPEAEGLLSHSAPAVA